MNKKILIIDDDTSILESLGLCLQDFGFDVKTLEKVESFDDFFQGFFPDLIILDYLLSGIDGKQIAKHLKGNKETKKIPIIMFSAHPFAKKELKDSGTEGFITKPFELDDLLKKIKKLI